MAPKPRPTEYRGIVFRSKAEARVALLLDYHCQAWWYEPEWLKLDDGYVPDFLTLSFEMFGPSERCEYAVNTKTNCVARYMIVEYKPIVPTETYMDELGKRHCQIQSGLRESAAQSFASSVPMYQGYTTAQCCVITGGMGYDVAMSNLLGDDPLGDGYGAGMWRHNWDPLFNWQIRVDVDAVNQDLSTHRFDLPEIEAH